MILKIERYVGNSGDWWLLDDIRKVSKTLIREVSFKEVKLSVDADVSILDVCDSLKDNSEQQVCDVMKLICRLSNGDEFCVIFDTIAYLLNDTGKTIEKIVANYKQ